jgi:hypothetical protein
LEASCICIRLYDLRGCIGQQVVRDIAHRLHGGRAQGVRVIAHSLHTDCARHCATEERRLCAFADFFAARIGMGFCNASGAGSGTEAAPY